MRQKLCLFLAILLVLAVLVIPVPMPKAEAYSWKDSWVDELQKEVEFLKWKVKYLTFELGDRMSIPAVDLISDRLDCDDAALYMYLYFTASGYKVDIIKGNLEKANETKSATDHVWVLVHSGNQTYPYDLGYCFNDDQHHEGYLINYKQLLYWVMEDQ